LAFNLLAGIYISLLEIDEINMVASFHS